MAVEKIKMIIKAVKRLVKMSVLLGFVALGSASFNAAAAVIAFETGTAGFGGDISFVLSPSGGELIGANIKIGALTIAGSSADGSYKVKKGVMSFNTVTETLIIEGKVKGLGINTKQTLLSGTMDDFLYEYSNTSPLNFFRAEGASELNTNLLSAIGLPGTAFDFFGYSIDVNSLGQVVDAGVINTSNASVVPLPAAAWLFISAIAGLAGAKRLSRAKVAA
jgi:hypothetical protein